MFTRLESHAQAIAPEGALVAYEVTPPPGGQTFFRGNVDLQTYDVSFAKSIPVGSSCCGCGDACGCDGGCGDACGCGSSCGCETYCCPQWELMWSGGLRFADVDWQREYAAFTDIGTLSSAASAALDFQGGGLRMGLEGRRYFFDGGLLSIYLKGDISLLLGDVDLVSQRTVEGGSTPDVVNIQTFHGRNIIPVTELEAGLTGQLTSHAKLSAGYFFSAWHDLAFRDQFSFETLLNTNYDDANILGFDGFFARLEFGF
jgi:hypothetical protein